MRTISAVELTPQSPLNTTLYSPPTQPWAIVLRGFQKKFKETTLNITIPLRDSVSLVVKQNKLKLFANKRKFLTYFCTKSEDFPLYYYFN